MTSRLIVAIVTAWLTACAPESPAPLVATQLDVTPSRPGSAMRAAYLTLRNNSDEEMHISRVSSPAFERVELHETVIEDGVARMRPVGELTLPPNAEIRLERGGLHLMLMRPVADAAARDGITLDFYDGNRLVISVTAPASENQGDSD